MRRSGRRCVPPESIDQAIGWAADELEGFMRG
jgi:hypothetical protein